MKGYEGLNIFVHLNRNKDPAVYRQILKLRLNTGCQSYMCAGALYWQEVDKKINMSAQLAVVSNVIRG